MALINELEQQGQWLFRWRSFLPLAFVPITVIALVNAQNSSESNAFHDYWELFCLGLSFFGLGVRAITVGFVPAGTSGRNTKGQCATSLNTTGIYSVVRHPLYLGNYLIGLGAMIVPFQLWLPLLYTACFFIYYERIMFAEEAFLTRKFGTSFKAWAALTPAMIPRLSQWRTSANSFSLRTILKREYTGFLVVILLHASMELVGHLSVERRIVYERKWALFLIVGLTVYLTLRALKKHSFLLHVNGR